MIKVAKQPGIQNMVQNNGSEGSSDGKETVKVLVRIPIGSHPRAYKCVVHFAENETLSSEELDVLLITDVVNSDSVDSKGILKLILII